MATGDNRILTTHVGSLVRPPDVVEAVIAIENGQPIDRAAFDKTLRAAVAGVVARQHEVGIDVVSDGEFGKIRSWAHYIIDRLGGIEQREMLAPTGSGKDQSLFPEFYAEYYPTQRLPKRGVLTAVGPITYTGQAAVAKDIAVFKEALAGVAVTDAFLPVVAPASAMPRAANEHYKSEEEFLFAVAEAMAVEYRAIVGAGLMVQVDDAFLPYMYDVAFADKPRAEYRKWCELRIDALNHALKGLPEDRVRYHICWGSFNTPHTTDVPISWIVDLIVKVTAGYYCIEMANPRHAHEWRVWEETELPEGRVLVPGVISHATNIVEHPELVAERLVRLARIVGRDNVMGGTDCGFSQSPLAQRVHVSIQWAKLAALAEGARLASKELWGAKAA
jgi:5-methyltetrahydropteroyltriglutamate--homocysteine methyltransferase